MSIEKLLKRCVVYIEISNDGHVIQSVMTTMIAVPTGIVSIVSVSALMGTVDGIVEYFQVSVIVYHLFFKSTYDLSK